MHRKPAQAEARIERHLAGERGLDQAATDQQQRHRHGRALPLRNDEPSQRFLVCAERRHEPTNETDDASVSHGRPT
jgi:hypothetical protein